MITSEKAGDILYSFTHHLTDIIEKDILDKGRYLGEPQRFYYTVLFKLRNVLDAASFLVKNLDGKPHYHDSTFLLLRTCLFDAVNLYYVMDQEANISIQKERIERIMFDHVKSIWICAQDDEERQLIIEKFPQCFKNGKFRKDIVKVNIITMYNEIDIQLLKDEAKIAIDLYNIFSKVEHNGILSFNLLHAHYENEGAISAKYKVFLACKKIMMVITLLIRHAWNISDKDGRFLELIRLNNNLILDR